jgi:glycosyltransferase involved in cell wall biosynthesis
MLAVVNSERCSHLRRRILLTCTHSGYGGVAKYVLDLAEFLTTSKKYRVFIAVGKEKPDLLPEMRKRAEKVFVIENLQRKINPIADLAAYFEIKKLLKSHSFDIVHSNGPKSGFLFRRVCFELNIPNIYTHHLVVYKQFKSMLNPLYKVLEKKASKWCNKIIVVTEAAKLELSSDGVTPGHMIEVVHNGLKDSEVKYIKEEVREKLGIPKNSFVFVSVSRLAPPKDPFTALSAFGKLSEEYSDLNILMFFIGDGSYKKEMMEIVEKKHLQRKVFVTGFRSDVDIYLAAGDVFILSTTKEGLPISILEAMKYSLPVIGSNVDGIPEEIIHGENGFLCKPGDVDEMYHYMKILIEDEKLRQKMGNMSKKILIENFMIHKNFSRIVEIYDKILGEV